MVEAQSTSNRFPRFPFAILHIPPIGTRYLEKIADSLAVMMTSALTLLPVPQGYLERLRVVIIDCTSQHPHALLQKRTTKSSSTKPTTSIDFPVKRATCARAKLQRLIGERLRNRPVGKAANDSFQLSHLSPVSANEGEPPTSVTYRRRGLTNNRRR